MKKRIDWTDAMDNLLVSQWTTKSRAEIASQLGMNEITLYRRAKVLGLRVREEKATYGGKIENPNAVIVASTMRFRDAYCAAAERNGWVIRNYAGQ